MNDVYLRQTAQLYRLLHCYLNANVKLSDFLFNYHYTMSERVRQYLMFNL